MDALDLRYVQLLRVGLLVLRQAVDAKDTSWVEAELEFLHNVPSLIGEPNLERHRYFWFGERDLYLSWVRDHGSDWAKSRMRTYYEPILKEMASDMEERLRPLTSPNGTSEVSQENRERKIGIDEEDGGVAKDTGGGQGGS